jgi:hypothetical protein
MKQYPTEAARAEGSIPGSAPAVPPAKTNGGRKVLTQIVLPLVLFVAVVGGITFVTQFGISRRSQTDKPQPINIIPLKFDGQEIPDGRIVVEARWDPYSSGYAAEFESKNGKGRYQFFFRNVYEKPVELGFTKKSCRCASVDVCRLTADEASALTTSLGPLGQNGVLHLLNLGFNGTNGLDRYVQRDLGWEELLEAKHKDEGLVIDPGTAGLVRMSWKSPEREESNQVRFTADLWMQVKGNSASRRRIQLATRVDFVPPVRSFPDTVELKDWNDGVARGEFSCWSATRTHFSLTARERDDDPCVEVQTTPLTPEECAEMESRMKKANFLSRVLSGYRVAVTVRQTQGDHALEQGHFDRYVSLMSKEIPTIPGVRVSGYVPGDVQVGEEQNKGKIRLGNFRVSSGKSAKIVLWTNPGMKFVRDQSRKTPDYKIEKTPQFMEVYLKEDKTRSTDSRTKWNLEVRVPPNLSAAWPRDSAVVLYTSQPDQPIRRVRIPIIANPYR